MLQIRYFVSYLFNVITHQSCPLFVEVDFLPRDTVGNFQGFHIQFIFTFRSPKTIEPASLRAIANSRVQNFVV
ncbi:hypothetical protein CKAN_00136800 [Cinnamomum micranthum f. kanehirae]|uniref:Uncharacterized protein n=1 Tax=Cinnamomum micranthum f. kanehirae TaxID=337451 RepID=A0A443N3M6_9MAGN|nr:hypothetical protein CKAN_00136800 [Cinnamomum micranthum f. kanehirae]